jgi:predicted RNA binding protein YcfA (HicA-like mRNA interferase family)
MKLPRDVSGAELTKVLCRHFGYRPVHQEGSHLILVVDTPSHRLSVPQHPNLRIGTLNAILRSVAEARGVAKEDILAKL